MNGFAALLHRMNYINRWGLMRNTRSESLAEHTLCTALIAHMLGCIANARFGTEVRPERIACSALYHDIAEIVTGDLPTPVKYNSDDMREAYKRVERKAERQLIDMLPEDLAGSIGPAITAEALSDRERAIIKAADKLSALIKCIEEEAGGNREFARAKESTLQALSDNPLPETALFLDEFLPAYAMTLDDLMTLKTDSYSEEGSP